MVNIFELNQMSDNEGPIWNRFWDSFDELETIDSASQPSDISSFSSDPNYLPQLSPCIYISPQPSTSLSQLKHLPDISPHESASMVNQTRSTFAFKFTLKGNKTYRVVCPPVFHILLEAVHTKTLSNQSLSLFYVDDENDTVFISCDADVLDAVYLARKKGQSRVKLIVHSQRQDTKQQEVNTQPKQQKIEQPTTHHFFFLPAAITFFSVMIVSVSIYSRK
ncbi:hypothetical protein CU098_011322 [Rhizopus stolonifer]|uniref:PB1 domain-containing protein n=1 Tax=Rhizopus stolonifer TaxID=4846 RepID=A0A367KKU3_RHIST|nr:hypothetical protein CU098_011322 [Rhizopus stolonifer]